MPARARATAVSLVACAALLAAAAVVLVVGGSPAGGSAGDAIEAEPTFTSTAAPPATEPDVTTAGPPLDATVTAAGAPQELLPTREPPGRTALFQRSDGVQLVGGGSPGRLDVGFVLAPGKRYEAVVNVGSDGDGTTVTRVLVVDAPTGDSVMVKMVPGAWGLPQPVPGGPPEGLAWNGSRIVLQSLDDASRFAAVSIDRPESAPIILAPVAGATFYALSGDGQTLLLSRRVGPDDTGEFALTAVRIRRADPEITELTHPAPPSGDGDAPVAAIPTLTPPVLVGTPTARVTTRDATYTVYTGAQRPAILEVRPGGTPAVRWHELPPADDDATAAGAWSLAASVDGETVVAANGVLGLAYLLRASGPPLELALDGRADGPPPLAVESSSTAYAVTDAGLEQLYLLEGTAHAFAAPEGLRGLLATQEGVLLLGGGATPLGVLAVAG